MNKISSADSLLSMIKNLANNKLSPSTPSSPQVTIALIIVRMMWATMEVMAMMTMVKVIVINMRVTMMMVMDTGGDTPAQISQ